MLVKSHHEAPEESVQDPTKTLTPVPINLSVSDSLFSKRTIQSSLTSEQKVAVGMMLIEITMMAVSLGSSSERDYGACLDGMQTTDLYFCQHLQWLSRCSSSTVILPTLLIIILDGPGPKGLE
jgi:hypothetical protein